MTPIEATPSNKSLSYTAGQFVKLLGKKLKSRNPFNIRISAYFHRDYIPVYVETVVSRLTLKSRVELAYRTRVAASLPSLLAHLTWRFSDGRLPECTSARSWTSRLSMEPHLHVALKRNVLVEGVEERVDLASFTT